MSHRQSAPCRPLGIILEIGMVLAAAAYLLTHCLHGLNTWEGGIVPNGALRMLRGELPYRDFYAYQPGRYLLLTLGFRWMGTSLRTARVVVALMTALGVWAVYRGSRRILPAPWSLVPAILFTMAPGAWHFRYLPVSLAFGMALTLHALARERSSAMRVLEGAAAGLILLLKLEIGLLAAFGVLAGSLWKDRSRRGVLAVLVGFAPALLLTGWFASLGPGLEHQSSFYVDYLIQGHLRWGTSWPTPLSAYSRGGWWRAFEALVCWWAPTLYLLVGGIVLPDLYRAWRQSTRGAGRRGLEPLVIAVWLWGLITQVLTLWRGGFGNSMRVLLPVLFLQTWLVCRLWRTADFRRRVQALLAYLPLLLFALGIARWGDEAAGALGEVRFSRVHLDDPRAGVHAPLPQGPWIRELVEVIRSATEPGEAILSVPMDTLLYFLADRPNPTYHEWFIPGTFRSSEEEERFVRNLAARPPRLVIYRDWAFDGQEERRLRNFAPRLERFVSDHYYVRQLIGPYEVRLPRGDILWDLATDLHGPTRTEVQGSLLTGPLEARPVVVMRGDARLAFSLLIPPAGGMLSGRLESLREGNGTAQILLRTADDLLPYRPAPGDDLRIRIPPGPSSLHLIGRNVRWVELRIRELTEAEHGDAAAPSVAPQPREASSTAKTNE